MASPPIYIRGKVDLLAWLAQQSLGCLLLRDTYTIGLTLPRFVADVAPYEVTALGYSRQALGALSLTWSTVTGDATLMAPSTVWASIAPGQNIGYVVTYYNTGSDVTSRLLSLAQYPVPIPMNGGGFTADRSASAYYLVF